MELAASRSELKRQAKGLEILAMELADLSAGEIATLPCAPELRQEIDLARTLKGGARKRQIKFISKALRQMDAAPLFAFLENKKGSKLKKDKAFHELERLRDAIIQEAIDTYSHRGEPNDEPEPGHILPAIVQAGEYFPDGKLDQSPLLQTAIKFARTRKPVYKREIFRSLQAAQERQRQQDKRQGK